MRQFQKPQFILVALLALVSLSCTRTQLEGRPTEVEELVPAAGQGLVQTTAQELDSTDTPVEESSRVSQSMNAITGGEIILSTSDGDSVKLYIPPFALAEDTEITLVSHSKAIDSPFRENFFPGIAIQPDGLSLRLPATLTITLSSHQIALSERIFYVKSPGLAIPLWQSHINGNSLT